MKVNQLEQRPPTKLISRMLRYGMLGVGVGLVVIVFFIIGGILVFGELYCATNAFGCAPLFAPTASNRTFEISALFINESVSQTTRFGPVEAFVNDRITYAGTGATHRIEILSPDNESLATGFQSIRRYSIDHPYIFDRYSYKFAFGASETWQPARSDMTIASSHATQTRFECTPIVQREVTRCIYLARYHEYLYQLQIEYSLQEIEMNLATMSRDIAALLTTQDQHIASILELD